MKSETIAPGVQLIPVPDDRFQTVRIAAHFAVPLRAETAAEYALLPRLLTRCCADYPDDLAFSRRLAMLYGAGVGGTAQVIGETQQINVSVSLLDDRFVPQDAPILPECTRLLCRMIFDPALTDGVFRAEDLVEEQRRLAEEIRAERNDLRTLALQQARRLMFAGEPYGLDRQGTAGQVEALTAPQLTAAWQRLLRTARVTILAVGTVDPAQVAAPLREAFARIDRDPVAGTEPVVHVPAAPRTVTEPVAALQSKLVMGFATPVRAPQETMAMRLAVALYGGTATSRLFLNVRERLSLCYYCAARYDRFKGVMLVDSGVQRENAEKAQAEILHQLDELKAGRFTDDELEAARLSMLDQIGAVSDSPAYLDSWYAGQLYRPLQTPDDAARDAAAVTRADVIAALQTMQPELTYLLDGQSGKDGDAE